MGQRRRVCLGMPGYERVTGGAWLGFFQATGGRHDVDRQQRESSLLAHNFNVLWCWALNRVRRGECDVFAMQHSDVEPEAGWLDVLIEEMESRDLDVLGVAVPIKDTRGVTSTALARDDGSTWRVHCRLTMSEILSLPETFTSDDVGRPLLLNTGLWVCRLREEWASRVHFEINDRIAQGPDGDYFPEVEPEDWFFSRQLHELGLRIGCTRKVRLGHRGQMVFGNDKAWGSEFDSEYVERSEIIASTGKGD